MIILKLTVLFFLFCQGKCFTPLIFYHAKEGLVSYGKRYFEFKIEGKADRTSDW